MQQIRRYVLDDPYDQVRFYAGFAEHHPEAAVIVPRAIAVSGDTVEPAPSQHDRHLQLVAEHGRMACQKASGYNLLRMVTLGSLPGVAALSDYESAVQGFHGRLSDRVRTDVTL